jgi:DNA-directed RNA polymerase subunit RPC12/RpoP
MKIYKCAICGKIFETWNEYVEHENDINIRLVEDYCNGEKE